MFNKETDFEVMGNFLGRMMIHVWIFLCEIKTYSAIFLIKPSTVFAYWMKSTNQFIDFSLPASADVAASDCIRCVKALPLIHFNYLNAAAVVVERFRSLKEKKSQVYSSGFVSSEVLSCVFAAFNWNAVFFQEIQVTFVLFFYTFVFLNIKFLSRNTQRRGVLPDWVDIVAADHLWRRGLFFLLCVPASNCLLCFWFSHAQKEWAALHKGSDAVCRRERKHHVNRSESSDTPAVRSLCFQLVSSSDDTEPRNHFQRRVRVSVLDF